MERAHIVVSKVNNECVVTVDKPIDRYYAMGLLTEALYMLASMDTAYVYKKDCLDLVLSVRDE